MRKQLFAFAKVAFVAAVWATVASAQPKLATGRVGAAPTGITLSGAAGAVTVAWTAAPGAATYRVLRAPNATAPGADLGPAVAGTSVIDKSAAAGTTYYYQVVATYADGRTGASSPVSYNVPKSGPVVQSGVSAPAVAPVPAVQPPAPPGPPVTQLQVVGSDPAIHTVTWTVQVFSGVTYTVYRQVLPNTTWQPLSPPGTYPYVNDTAVFAPNTATYRVVSHYSDGREGIAQVAYPNPPAMVSPASITAQQIGEGRVVLTWPAVNTAHGYRVYGPGLPADGQLVAKGTADTVSGVSLGSQTFRVATWYLKAASTTSVPSATVNVVRWTAHYRVTFNGFYVAHPMDHGLFARQGNFDEVYAAADVFQFTRNGGQPTMTFQHVITSRVYGDAGSIPGIVQAGSASPMGGLKAGDRIPVNAASPSTNPGSDRFPLLVWDGVITANSELVVIAPSLWESDANMTSLNDWAQQQSDHILKFTTHLALDAVQSGLSASNLTLVPFLKYVDGQPGESTGDRGRGWDRAIGMINRGDDWPVLLDNALVIGQEQIERILNAANTSRIILPIGFVEDNTGNPASYTLYVQVERIP